MSGFTDIHAHFLYGVDDGARTKEDMEAMLDAAVADGVGTLVATPHQTPGVKPFNRELFREHLQEAREYCREKNYSLSIFGGSELLYTPMMDQSIRENRLTTYEGRSFVLVEFVPDVSFEEMDHALGLMIQQGYDVVVAHIERYKCLAMRGAYRMKDRHDVRYQMNCHTITGDKGFFTDQRTRQWLKDRLIDAVATDSHDRRRRPTRMKEAYAALVKEVGTTYARKLTGKTND